jgi:hypothetical protein
MEAEETMTTRIKLRRDTAASWISANPILSGGEPGLETDTARIKYGDGVTKWRDLDYANSKISGHSVVEINTNDPNSWVNIMSQPKNQSAVTAVAYDTQGNVITVQTNFGGTGQASGYNRDGFVTVTKVDSSGATLWQYDIDNAGYAIGGGLDTDEDGNIYVSLMDVNDLPYVVVIKLDSDGVSQWQEGFGHFADGSGSLVVDMDGHPVVNGYSGDPGSDGCYVLRLNKMTGAVMLTVRYTSDENENEITPQGMAIDSDNNVVIIGSNSDGGEHNLIIQKLSGVDFTPIWTKMIGTINDYDMYGGGVACDGAGNIYITATFNGTDTIQTEGTSHYTMAVMKLNTEGAVQWSRDVRGECSDGGSSIVVGPNDGNLYLASISYEPIYIQNEAWHASKQTVALACYNSTTGKVIWQKYIENSQLGKMSAGTNNDSNWQYIQGQSIDMRGDHVVVGGQFEPLFLSGGGWDTGLISGWVMQFPSNGEDVDIGGWKTVTSRIPGRFQSFQTTNYSINYYYDAFDYGQSTNMTVFSGSDITTTHITQDHNTWNFDLKGDLNLPEDGDLAIHKRQIGWVNLQGFEYNDFTNIEFGGVCVDPLGNSYAYGYNDEYERAYVVKYSPTGEGLWQMLIDNSPSGNIYGESQAGAWDPVANQLVIVTNRYDTPSDVVLVTRIDPQTGSVVSNTTISAGDKSLQSADVQIMSDGSPVVVGLIIGGSKGFTVTVNTSTSGVDYLDVLASDFTDGHVPKYNDSNWLITGPGLTGEQCITSAINKYSPLTAVVSVGSGATFNITASSSSFTTVAAQAVGSGYKVNDLISIPATSLGLTSSSNPLVVSIDSVDGSGGITSCSIFSSPAAGADAVFTAVSGTPITGSGATFYAIKALDGATPIYLDYDYIQIGHGYKVGDVLTIRGTDLGGASPANDISFTLNSVNIQGGVSGWNQNGTITPSMTTVRLTVDNGSVPVNFSLPPQPLGSWKVGYTTYNDGFIWTPTWTRIIGTPNAEDADGEEFTSVAIDRDNNVFVGMQLYNNNFFSGNYPTSAVIKLNSAGAIQWSRCLDNEAAPKETPIVATDSEGSCVVAVLDYEYGRVIGKFNSTGTLLWSNAPDFERVFYQGPGSIGIDADDNIIVTGDDDNSNWAISKLDSNGFMLFNRMLRGPYDTYSYNDRGTRWTAVQGDHFWTAGYTSAQYDEDYYNGFVAKLPLDGTGLDGSDVFVYTDEQVLYAKVTAPGYYGDFSAHIEIHNTQGITAVTETMITYSDTYFITKQYAVTAPSAGGIVFADGTRQDTSASDLPQRSLTGDDTGINAAYRLQLSDRGRHILLGKNQNVLLPDYNLTEFPIGTVLTLVNTSGSNRRLYIHNPYNTDVGISGTNSTAQNYGGNDIWLEIPYYEGGNIVTLLKILGKPSEGDGLPAGYAQSFWIASGTGLGFND